MEDNKKNIALFLTGGLDSTYLAYDNLKKGNKIHPFYIEVQNNQAKADVEWETVLSIYELLSKEFSGLIEYPSKLLKLIAYGSHSTHALVQPPMWIFGASMLQNGNYGDKFDEIQISYVLGDCAVSYIEDIKNLYNSYQGIMRRGHNLVPLSFPLLKYSKEEILDSLPEKYAQQVFSCENPRSKLACGNCTPCRGYLKIFVEKIGMWQKYPRLVDMVMYGKIRAAFDDYDNNRYTYEVAAKNLRHDEDGENDEDEPKAKVFSRSEAKDVINKMKRKLSWKEQDVDGVESLSDMTVLSS